MPDVFIPDNPEEIINQYKDMVYRIALAYCRNSADAEDVTQAVFLRYLKMTPNTTGENNLKAWLIRVAINVSKSLLRSAWRKKTVSLDEQSALEERGEFDADDPAGLGLDTYHAVMSLPEKYRSVVLLYYYEDYSVKEIARILRRTETAVQTQLQRARVMLKDKLKEDWKND
jgi:RNA polymerase sigma-70 factor (ECF subfamily)